MREIIHCLFYLVEESGDSYNYYWLEQNNEGQFSLHYSLNKNWEDDRPIFSTSSSYEKNPELYRKFIESIRRQEQQIIKS